MNLWGALQRFEQLEGFSPAPEQYLPIGQWELLCAAMVLKPASAPTRRGAVILVAFLAFLGVAFIPRVGATTAHSAAALLTISPQTQTHLSGSPATYNLSLSCAGVGGSSCGSAISVRIPLDQSISPSMETDWSYGASSAVSGLISSGPTIDTGTHELVMTLDPTVFVTGVSGTIRLTATPPNSTTPNNTSWSFTPSLESDAFATVTAPKPAVATATAKPQVSVAKSTVDGGSVYLANGQIIFNLAAKCTTPTQGNLYVSTATLVDVLPAGLTYVSSLPTASSVVGQTITWDLRPPEPNLPAGCAAGSGGAATNFKIVTQGPATGVGSMKNTATFSGTGPDATDAAGVTSTASSTKTVATVVNPPIGPGTGYASISKSSLAPLPQAGVSTGNQYISTYPGNWVPLGTNPTYNIGQAAASYQTTVSYSLVGVYQSAIYDPVPCLDTPLSGTRVGYTSASYNAATACAHPAFIVQKFTVSAPGTDTSNGLGQAYLNGWRPQVLLLGGSAPVDVAASGSVSPTASSITFTTVTTAGTIILPPSSYLVGPTMRLTVFGYADPSLAGLNSGLSELENRATVVPQNARCNYQGISGSCQPLNWAASVFTVPPQPMLGIAKSFGTLSGNGNATMQLTGSVATPTALTNNVVLTDWLPRGMSLVNPPASGSFTIASGSNGSSSTTGTITVLNDYQSSGRQLLRITIPASSFSATSGVGYFKISSAANLLTVRVATTTPALYPNTAQIFLYDLGSTTHLASVCGTPSQTSAAVSTATFENDNANDLAGDGNLNEDYCQNLATLSVKANGAFFSLTKTVQGDLDPAAKGPLGIGEASKLGSGLYQLTWSNVGSDVMKNAVVYDLLPHVGDTGVSQLQSLVPRGSEFRPTFLSANSLSPGIVIEYSASSNPCRDEVFPNADNPGCVDDWSTLLPVDLSTVTAVRFSGAGPFAFGQGFDTTITLQVPAGEYNKVAWNSAATNAMDVSNPSTETLPAEPPKVGLRTTTHLGASSVTSLSTTTPEHALSDAVTLSNLGNNSATLDWTLYGPIATETGSCDSLDWSQAPVLQTGTLSVSNDSTTNVGPATLGDVGCYSWGYVITTAGPTVVTIDPGQPGENTLVASHQPRMVTTAGTSGSSTAGWSLHDSVTLTKTGINPASRVATSADLHWSLVGPLAPVNGSCHDVKWSTALQAAAGTVTVTKDGTWSTPDVSVTAPGCYSFGELLEGNSNRSQVLQRPGIEAETVSLTTDPVTTTSTPNEGTIAYTGDRIRLLLPAGFVLSLIGSGLVLLRRRTRA